MKNDMNLLHFPNETLPPIDDLLALATVTAQDIEAAVLAWENNPPDDEFKLILRAEVEDGT